MPYVDCPQFIYSNFKDSSKSSSDGIQVVARSAELMQHAHLDSIKFRSSIGLPVDLSSLDDWLLSEDWGEGKRALVHFVPSTYSDAFGRTYPVTHIILIPSAIAQMLCRNISYIFKPAILNQARQSYYRQDKDIPLPPIRIEYEDPDWHDIGHHLHSIYEKQNPLFNLAMNSADALLNNNQVRITNFNASPKEKIRFFENLALILPSETFSHFSFATTVYDQEQGDVRIAFLPEDMFGISYSLGVKFDASSPQLEGTQHFSSSYMDYVQKIAHLGGQYLGLTLEHSNQISIPAGSSNVVMETIVRQLQIADGPTVWKLLLQNGSYKANDVITLIQARTQNQSTLNWSLAEVIVLLLKLVLSESVTEIRALAEIISSIDSLLTEDTKKEILEVLVNQSLAASEKNANNSAIDFVSCWKLSSPVALESMDSIILEWANSLVRGLPDPFTFLESCNSLALFNDASLFNLYVSVLSQAPSTDNLIRILKSSYFKSKPEELRSLTRIDFLTKSLSTENGVAFALLQYFTNSCNGPVQVDSLVARTVEEIKDDSLLLVIGNYALELQCYEFLSPTLLRAIGRKDEGELRKFLTLLSSVQTSSISLATRGAATFLGVGLADTPVSKLFPVNPLFDSEWEGFLAGFIFLANSEDSPGGTIDKFLLQLDTYIGIQVRSKLSSFLIHTDLIARCFRDAVELFSQSAYPKSESTWVAQLLLQQMRGFQGMPWIKSMSGIPEKILGGILRRLIQLNAADEIAEAIHWIHVNGIQDDVIVLKSFTQVLQSEMVEADSSTRLRFEIALSLARLMEVAPKSIRLETYIDDIDLGDKSIRLENLQALYQISGDFSVDKTVKRKIVDAIISHSLLELKAETFAEYAFKEIYPPGVDVGNWLMAYWRPRTVSDIMIMLNNLRGKQTPESKHDYADLAEQTLFRGEIPCDPKLVLDYLRTLLKQPLTRWRNLSTLNTAKFTPILSEYPERKELQSLCLNTMRIITEKRPDGRTVPMLLNELASGVSNTRIKAQVSRFWPRKQKHDA